MECLKELGFVWVLWYLRVCIALEMVLMLCVENVVVIVFRVTTELILKGHLFRKGQMKIAVFRMYQVLVYT